MTIYNFKGNSRIDYSEERPLTDELVNILHKHKYKMSLRLHILDAKIIFRTYSSSIKITIDNNSQKVLLTAFTAIGKKHCDTIIKEAYGKDT